jgi:hypothetical protein
VDVLDLKVVLCAAPFLNKSHRNRMARKYTQMVWSSHLSTRDCIWQIWLPAQLLATSGAEFLTPVVLLGGVTWSWGLLTRQSIVHMLISRFTLWNLLASPFWGRLY